MLKSHHQRHTILFVVLLFTCLVVDDLILSVGSLALMVPFHNDVQTTTTTTAALIGDGNKTRITSLHRVALPPRSDTSLRVIRDLWKWKDLVLGDGRDYFVPRPRAIRALTDRILATAAAAHSSQQHPYQVVECGILSNCARLDVVLVIQSTVSYWNDTTSFIAEQQQQQQAKHFAKHIVACTLLSQLQAYYNKRLAHSSARTFIIDSVSSLLDLSGMVVESNMDDGTTSSTELYKNLYHNHLVHSSNSTDIIQYFCNVAAGIQCRPSRPTRSVVFRPYSSRDAHIMLQIKRTAEIVSSYSFPRTKILLDTALQVGKGARNPTRVPSIVTLREYESSKSFPPLAIVQTVLQEVQDCIMDPMIQKCHQRWQALDSSNAIVSLQNQVDALLYSFFVKVDLIQPVHGVRTKEKETIPPSLMKRIQPILHTSYMTLRKETQPDAVNQCIQKALIQVQEEVNQWYHEL
jgi:hypothetical protein